MGQSVLLAKDVTAEKVKMRKKVSDCNTGKPAGEVKDKSIIMVYIFLVIYGFSHK